MNKLFDGKTNMLCIDQYGRREWARSRKELCETAGFKHCSKQYSEMRDGGTYWTGYVVGPRWFTIYEPRKVRQ